MSGQYSWIVMKVMILLYIIAIANHVEGGCLRVGFYRNSCKGAEDAIRNVTADYLKFDRTLAASLLRLHFHDCFVNGCDGSVLLNSTSTNEAEKDAIPNLTLRGFYVINDAKAAVETICPGVVSCADIVALVARDSINLIGGPYWELPTGRRDGNISRALDALQNIPAPFFNFQQLLNSFESKGLSLQDLVTLSGGHTIGVSHCSTIEQRLYNFTGVGDTDPDLDAAYASELKQKCKPGDQTTTIPMDALTPLAFDSKYYVGVKARRGLFQSDAALLKNFTSSVLVEIDQQFNSIPFFGQFTRSIIKMGSIDVLTGDEGEIRHDCALVNNSS